MAVNGLPRLHLKEAVFSALAHNNYVDTYVSLFFQKNLEILFLGKMANFKFGLQFKNQR